MSRMRTRFLAAASQKVTGRPSSRITRRRSHRLPGVCPAHHHSNSTKYPDHSAKTATMRSASTHFGALLAQLPTSEKPTPHMTLRPSTPMTSTCKKWSKAHARNRLPVEASAKCSGTRSGVSMTSVSSVWTAADMFEPRSVERRQRVVSVGRVRPGVEAERAELLEHGHEVEVVPRLDDLAARDADDA